MLILSISPLPHCGLHDRIRLLDMQQSGLPAVSQLWLYFDLQRHNKNFLNFIPIFFSSDAHWCSLKRLPCSLLLVINNILFHLVFVQNSSETLSPILAPYSWPSSLVPPYNHFPLNCFLLHLKLALTIFYAGCRTTFF